MTPTNKTPLCHLGARLKNEDGGITVLNVFFTIALAIFSGVAIDMASLISARTQLQIAADVAGHAALYERSKAGDVAAAKDVAVRVAKANMSTSRYGDILKAEDIHFGTYDQSAKSFSIDENQPNAVWIETSRLGDKANPVSSYLLQFVGFWDWNVRTTSVFTREQLRCTGEGFYAVGRVDLQSNNQFHDGFCIHSDTQVELNQNNYFDVVDGVRVSMPTYGDLILAEDGFLQNENLWEARVEAGPYMPNVDKLIDEVIAGIMAGSIPHGRSFIDSTVVIDVTPGSGGGGVSPDADAGTEVTADAPKEKDNGGGGKSNALSMADLTPKRIHNVSCPANGTLSVSAETFENVVVITDCNYSFANGVVLDNATFITNSTDANNSIGSPQGLQIGRDDNCAADGGAQLITRGGMKSAAKMQLYGGQIIAAGDVNFAAQGTGFRGSSVIAGGEIDGTSLNSFGGCKTGMEDFFTLMGQPRLRG